VRKELVHNTGDEQRDLRWHEVTIVRQ
jgi:hypothetical protein